MIPLVCLFGAFQGAVVERIGVRPAIKIKSEFGWIMSTIALGIIFKNVAENVWGRDDLKFPSPLPESPMKFLGANVLPMEILVVVGAILMMLAVEFFNRKTIYGKAVVATFNDRDAAKLMGINTGLVITFSYALSSLTAGFAGVLIAPRADQRHGDHRGRDHPRRGRDDDGFLHQHRLQGCAWLGAAADRARGTSAGPVRQEHHQEGLSA
jgi:branched-chain amino acid transport system permease protein